jgi:hypothetical protein
MEYKVAIKTTTDRRKVISRYTDDANSPDTLADDGSLADDRSGDPLRRAPLTGRVPGGRAALANGYRFIRAIDTRLPPGGVKEISLMLLFFTRTMIVPSASTVKCIRSPGLRFAAARMSFGIVV